MVTASLYAAFHDESRDAGLAPQRCRPGDRGNPVREPADLHQVEDSAHTFQRHDTCGEAPLPHGLLQLHGVGGVTKGAELQYVAPSPSRYR